jgi:hypothetical protein
MDRVGQIRQHWQRKLETAATISVNQAGAKIEDGMGKGSPFVGKPASRRE